jgi:hypothetical protein
MNEQEKKVAKTLLQMIQLLADASNDRAIAWVESYERLCAAVRQRVEAEQRLTARY